MARTACFWALLARLGTALPVESAAGRVRGAAAQVFSRVTASNTASGPDAPHFDLLPTGCTARLLALSGHRGNSGLAAEPYDPVLSSLHFALFRLVGLPQ